MRGLRVTPGNVLITLGSLQGLRSIAVTTIRRGNRVAVEIPGLRRRPPRVPPRRGPNNRRTRRCPRCNSATGLQRGPTVFCHAEPSATAQRDLDVGTSLQVYSGSLWSAAHDLRREPVQRGHLNGRIPSRRPRHVRGRVLVPAAHNGPAHARKVRGPMLHSGTPNAEPDKAAGTKARAIPGTNRTS